MFPSRRKMTSICSALAAAALLAFYFPPSQEVVENTSLGLTDTASIQQAEAAHHEAQNAAESIAVADVASQRAHQVDALEAEGTAKALIDRLDADRAELALLVRDAYGDMNKAQRELDAGQGDLSSFEANFGQAVLRYELLSEASQLLDENTFRSSELVEIMGKLYAGESLIQQKQYLDAIHSFDEVRLAAQTLSLNLSGYPRAVQAITKSQLASLAWDRLEDADVTQEVDEARELHKTAVQAFKAGNFGSASEKAAEAQAFWTSAISAGLKHRDEARILWARFALEEAEVRALESKKETERINALLQGSWDKWDEESGGFLKDSRFASNRSTTSMFDVRVSEDSITVHEKSATYRSLRELHYPDGALAFRHTAQGASKVENAEVHIEGTHEEFGWFPGGKSLGEPNGLSSYHDYLLVLKYDEGEDALVGTYQAVNAHNWDDTSAHEMVPHQDANDTISVIYRRN